MLKHLLPSLRITLLLALLTGLIFPCAMTALCQLLFPEQANGSLCRNHAGRLVGSKLVGQQFSKPEYFHARPSAAGSGYAGESSGGTNLGPTSLKLMEGSADNPATEGTDESFAGVRQLAEKYRQENRLESSEKVPVDAVSRSGSGLDPDISLANAFLQSRRVALARGLSLERVQGLVFAHMQRRQFGFLGEPHVNVLAMNLSLDELTRK
jgi:potassium-transporting ATPase KdpC subunit